MATEGDKKVMVVGMDESKHSMYALEWTLLHFFNQPNSSSAFRLVVVHSKPSPASVVSFTGAGAMEVMPYIDSDLKKISARVLQNAKELCHMNSVADAHFEVVEGDARNALCEAVERHHADILVVGSHGYGAFKRVVLGSVSDYCAHHAHCTVMIVKKPKQKH